MKTLPTTFAIEQVCPEVSQIIQEKFFKNGFGWTHDDLEYRNLSPNYLISYNYSNTKCIGYSLRDFYEEENIPIISLKEFFEGEFASRIKLNEKCHGEMQKGKVAVYYEGSEYIVKNERIREIAAALANGLPENWAIRVPTQELWDIVVKKLKLTYSPYSVDDQWANYKENTVILEYSGCKFASSRIGAVGSNMVFISIEELFLKMPPKISLLGFDVIIAEKHTRVACQEFDNAVIKELAAKLID